MLKKEQRQLVLDCLKQADEQQKQAYDKELLERFLALSVYQQADTLAVYLAFDFEYNTQLIIDRALSDGKRVLIPKTYPKGKMVFVPYNPEDLEQTLFGLWEPKSDEAVPKSEVDLILVPGLVFNKDGFRIGYGGGYYDRYLSSFQGSTVSLIYPYQQREFMADGHDIAVQEVLCATD